jgi:hypothetical protein
MDNRRVGMEEEQARRPSRNENPQHNREGEGNFQSGHDSILRNISDCSARVATQRRRPAGCRGHSALARRLNESWPFKLIAL